MPCAAGELCHIPDRTPESQNAHECRGGCGGRLHGLCGEVQEQVSDNLIHRICPSCLERDRKAFTVAATTAAACSSSSGTKRKIGTTGHSEDVNVKKSKPHTPGGASGKSRVRLSHGQKMDVLGLLKERVSHAQIAHRFGCGERTVSNIAQQRKKLEEEDKLAGCDQSAKSRRRGYFPKVDDRVLSLVEEARKVGLPVTRAVIQSFGHAAKKAVLEEATTTQDETKRLEAFGASVKWAKNFVSRNGMPSHALRGEAGNVDTAAIEKGLKEIRKVCEKYSLRNVFNVDKTILFYKVLPRITYLAESGTRKTTRGAKDMEDEDRISAYMCTNATGTAKVDMSIIGKSEYPRCFRWEKTPVKYFSQNNAWSDGPTFRKWWLEVFLPFVRRWTHEPVLLLINGSLSYGGMEDPTRQVTVMMYPPNCASKHQPMGLGIIATTKVYYRSRLLSLRASTVTGAETLRAQSKDRKMVAGTVGLAEGHSPHMLDAAELLHSAWGDVTEHTIARCWIKAETLPVTYQAILAQESGKYLGHDAQDAVREKLMEALNALSVGVHSAAQSPSIAGEELCEVLADLEIVPGEPANEAAVKMAQAWAGLEEQEEIAAALKLDSVDVLTEAANNISEDQSNPSDEKVEENNRGGLEGARVGIRAGLIPPPSYAELGQFFGPLEKVAASCGNDEAGDWLRKAKMSFIAEYSSHRTRQAGFGEYAQE